jgi:3-hydroxybutyryl-CoA dehydrogenase
MGPLTLMDLIGLDVSLEVCEAIFRETRDRRHAPAPILRRLVTAGLLVRKTGRGFYDYSEETAEPEAATGPPPSVGVVGSGPLALAIVKGALDNGADVRFVAGDDTKVRAVREALGDRATGGTDLALLAGCDLVVEAVAEDTSVKRSLLAAVDDVAKKGAVLATTATTIPVIELAMATDRPEDVVGLHLPDPEGELVELVATVVTDPGVLRQAEEHVARIGRRPVRSADRAGFIVEALRVPYLNDAVRMLEAGYADADAIDAAMTHGCGYPIGPIADLDRIGLGHAVEVLRALYTEYREPAFAPAPLLDRLRTAGATFR